MEVRPGYKQTELGVIPQDWEVRQFSEHFRIYAGGDVPRHSLSQTQSAAHPHPIFANALQNKGLYGFTAERRSNANSLTITARGYLGYAEYRDEPFFPIVRLLVLEPTGQLDARYTAYSVNDRVKFSIESTGVPQLTAPQVGKYCVAAPPTVAEQRAIATALGNVDALLGGLDRLIVKKRELKQAAMQQLLTGQIRLPSFHREWEVKRLGDLANLNRLSVIPASQPNSPFVHFSLPAFDDGKSAQVELGATIGSNKFRVPSHAVLVSKLNPRIPRTWAPKHVPENACASTEWLVLTPREGTERNFLFVLCSSPGFCQQMELAATGTTGSHQRISPTMALDICVAVPIDQTEQIAIATVLSDMDAEIAALEVRRDKTRDLKQAMMQELLTGRTRLV